MNTNKLQTVTKHPEDKYSGFSILICALVTMAISIIICFIKLLMFV
jgi:hypothetical protein